MNSKTLLLRAAVALVLLIALSGCNSEPETRAQSAGTPSGALVVPASTGQPAPSSDVQSLQNDRKQDAKVLQDAQKAVGALHP